MYIQKKPFSHVVSMEPDKSFPFSDIPFRILLADDDEDEHFFFEDVVTKLPFHKQVNIVENGEKLLKYLLQEKQVLPDVLFLDYNLPRKNGLECLLEIKRHAALKDLKVIMYSTYMHEDVADTLYNQGALFFVRKTDSKSLEKILHKVFTHLIIKKTVRSQRESFIITV